jgi:hypothetical protein
MSLDNKIVVKYFHNNFNLNNTNLFVYAYLCIKTNGTSSVIQLMGYDEVLTAYSVAESIMVGFICPTRLLHSTT